MVQASELHNVACLTYVLNWILYGALVTSYWSIMKHDLTFSNCFSQQGSLAAC